MPSTWILVADRSSARLLAVESQQQLRVLATFSHPEGRLHDREIDSDKPGRTFDSLGRARHSNEPPHSPTENLANEFARDLAKMLERARTDHRFDKLVLVADRKFLGRLRLVIGQETMRLVTATLDKNLSGIADRDLHGHLVHLLKPDATAPI